MSFSRPVWAFGIAVMVLAMASSTTRSQDSRPRSLQRLDNFCPNPSFLEDANGDRVPDGWSASSFESSGTAVWDRQVGRRDSNSIRLSDPGKSSSRDWKKSVVRWSSDSYPVAPQTEYRLEAWIKTRGVTGRARIILAWLRQGKWLDEVASAPVAGTTKWQLVTVTARAPKEADSLRITFELGYGEGAAWLDDVRISGMSRKPARVDFKIRDTSGWFTFDLSKQPREPVFDLRQFLDPPAGKHGFLEVRSDGHFYFKNGSRLRFFGLNLVGRDCLPEKKLAKTAARRFASFGVNLVRFHALDGTYSGLIDYQRGGSRELSADALDRLDYFIAALKEEGIYVYLDLLDYRMFRTADGVAEGDDFTHNWAGSMKGASIFDDRMIALQKEYATKLLGHRNRYTGFRYADDPAIALVEITNENSVFYFLLMKNLSRPYYREALRKRWNVWLFGKYETHDRLVESWSDSQGRSDLAPEESLVGRSILLPPPELVRFSKGKMPNRNAGHWGAGRMRDFLAFLGEIQERYFREMRAHLIDSIGVQAPITGTNQVFVLKDLQINARHSDFVARNQYWQHPNVRAKPHMLYSNLAMLRADLAAMRSPYPVFAASSVAGKPLILSEFNFPWPNEFRAEGLLSATAYACLQDWDGVLLFGYRFNDPAIQTFPSHADPMRWGTFPAAAWMFHRGDVPEARNEIHLLHTREEVDRLGPDSRYAPHDHFRYLVFLSKVRHGFVEDGVSRHADAYLLAGGNAPRRLPTDRPAIRLPDDPSIRSFYRDFQTQAAKLGLDGFRGRTPDVETTFRSDNGCIELDSRQGVLTVETARTISSIGFVAGKPIEFDHAGVTCRTDFSAITVTSLDGLPIGTSKRLLITAVSRAQNSGEAFWPGKPNPNSWSPYMTWKLIAPGRPPVRVEPVDADVAIEMPGSVTAYALDEAGRRRETLPVKRSGDRVEVSLKDAGSIWIELVQE